MSLETWKAEFYPVDAKDATQTERQALAHAILKWSGLTLENLEKHKVISLKGSIKDASKLSSKGLKLNSGNCALCVLHDLRDSPTVNPDCEKCCLYKTKQRLIEGDLSCTDLDYRFSCEEEFSKFVLNGDARPMLKLLAKVKEFLERTANDLPQANPAD